VPARQSCEHAFSFARLEDEKTDVRLHGSRRPGRVFSGPRFALSKIYNVCCVVCVQATAGGKFPATPLDDDRGWRPGGRFFFVSNRAADMPSL